MDFDAVVVYVTTFSHLFRFALAKPYLMPHTLLEIIPKHMNHSLDYTYVKLTSNLQHTSNLHKYGANILLNAFRLKKWSKLFDIFEKLYMFYIVKKIKIFAREKDMTQMKTEKRCIMAILRRQFLLKNHNFLKEKILFFNFIS